jgi:hypothetical protein
MPLRYSSGAVDFFQENGGQKEAFHDGIIDIYSGSQPASADAAKTGTHLARITLAGGAFTAGVKSTRRMDKATITYDQDGDAYALVINGTSYSYTSEIGNDADDVALALAALVDASPVVSATAIANVITVRALYGGVDYTIANTGTTTGGNNVVASVIANARINGLQWGDSVLGVLSKESGVWEGVNLASGTAGYFRFKANAVDDDSESTSLVRLDGNISTSNAPLIISGGINLIKDAITTVQAGTGTRPKS